MGPCSMGTWGCSRPVCGAGGRQQEDAGASRAAGVNLEIAKNLAWQRAGGQRASLAARGGMAPLPHGARFPCARPGEVPAICPGSSGSFRSFPVLSGCWGAARQLLGCACVCVCVCPAGVDADFQPGRAERAAGPQCCIPQLLVPRHINKQECANIQRSVARQLPQPLGKQRAKAGPREG